MTLAVLSFAIMELIPDILDFALPLNESRMHYLPPVNEYRGYQEAYFYPVLFYVIASTITGLITIVSVGMMLLSIILHCCAIFKISR